jgi:hypothetical protein
MLKRRGVAANLNTMEIDARNIESQATPTEEYAGHRDRGCACPALY